MRAAINRYKLNLEGDGAVPAVTLVLNPNGLVCKLQEVELALEAEFQRGRQAPRDMPGFAEYNEVLDEVRSLAKVTETAGHEVVALTEKIATLHDSHNDLGQDHMKLRQDVGRKGNLESKSLVEIMTDRDKRLFLAERAQDPARGLGALRKRVGELEGLVSANSHNTQAHHTRLDDLKTRLRLVESGRGSDRVAHQLQVDFHQKLVNRVVRIENADRAPRPGYAMSRAGEEQTKAVISAVFGELAPEIVRCAICSCREGRVHSSSCKYADLVFDANVDLPLKKVDLPAPGTPGSPCRVYTENDDDTLTCEQATLLWWERSSAPDEAPRAFVLLANGKTRTVLATEIRFNVPEDIARDVVPEYRALRNLRSIRSTIEGFTSARNPVADHSEVRVLFKTLLALTPEHGAPYLPETDAPTGTDESLAGAALLEIGSRIREFKHQCTSGQRAATRHEVNLLLNAILAAGDIQGKEPAVSRERAALDRIQGTVVGFRKSYHLATESCKGAGVGPLLEAVEAATRTGLG